MCRPRPRQLGLMTLWWLSKKVFHFHFTFIRRENRITHTSDLLRIIFSRWYELGLILSLINKKSPRLVIKYFLFGCYKNAYHLCKNYSFWAFCHVLIKVCENVKFITISNRFEKFTPRRMLMITHRIILLWSVCFDFWMLSDQFEMKQHINYQKSPKQQSCRCISLIITLEKN